MLVEQLDFNLAAGAVWQSKSVYQEESLLGRKFFRSKERRMSARKGAGVRSGKHLIRTELSI
jgi:hypothetical protein